MKADHARSHDLVAAAFTHRGGRAANQDGFFLDIQQRRFAVIDGMGGYRGGELAVEVAQTALATAASLPAAFLEASDGIRRLAADRPDVAQMGCVMTAAHLTRTKITVAHAGDTMAMLANRDGCTLLTQVHTQAAEMQTESGLAYAQAARRAGHNVVLRDLGAPPDRGDTWIERWSGYFDPGDLLCLCSDGLSGALGTPTLLRSLTEAWRAHEAPELLVRRLVNTALERGARDNVTALVVRRRQGRWRQWDAMGT